MKNCAHEEIRTCLTFCYVDHCFAHKKFLRLFINYGDVCHVCVLYETQEHMNLPAKKDDEKVLQLIMKVPSEFTGLGSKVPQHSKNPSSSYFHFPYTQQQPARQGMCGRNAHLSSFSPTTIKEAIN